MVREAGTVANQKLGGRNRDMSGGTGDKQSQGLAT